MEWWLIVVGLVSGLITGMLSLGGGISMIFLLLTLPIVFHLPILSMHQISNMVAIQSVFALISGAYVYLREGTYHKEAFLFTGLGGFGGAIVGAWLSHLVRSEYLIILYAAISTLAAILMFVPKRERHSTGTIQIGLQKWIRRVAQFFVGFTIATLGGVLGITAGFLLVPVMLYLFGYPIKTTLGTGILIGTLIAFGGGLERIMYGNFPLFSSLFLVLGAIPGGYIGGKITKKLNGIIVRRVASIAIVLISLNVWYKILI